MGTIFSTFRGISWIWKPFLVSDNNKEVTRNRKVWPRLFQFWQNLFNSEVPSDKWKKTKYNEKSLRPRFFPFFSQNLLNSEAPPGKWEKQKSNEKS